MEDRSQPEIKIILFDSLICSRNSAVFGVAYNKVNQAILKSCQFTSQQIDKAKITDH
jgi:hypothetical protein